jgi:hypothetical protein
LLRQYSREIGIYSSPLTHRTQLEAFDVAGEWPGSH